MTESEAFGRDILIMMFALIAMLVVAIGIAESKQSYDKQAYEQEFRNLKIEEITVKILDKKMLTESFKSGKHSYRTSGYYLFYTEKETFRNEEGQKSDTIFATLEVNQTYVLSVRLLDVGSEYRTILEIREKK